MKRGKYIRHKEFNRPFTRKHQDFTGQRVGTLTVLHEAGRNSSRSILWSCRCDCGIALLVSSHTLRNKIDRLCICGKTSCESTPKPNEIARILPGGRNLIRTIWDGIKIRCYNRMSKYYHRYGGRGIKLCDEWLKSFIIFQEWCLANGWKHGLHIDRIDNDGDYCPSNCRFITPRENSFNKEISMRIYYGGATKTLLDLERLGCGVSAQNIRHRLKTGWSVEEAIHTPVGQPRN